MLPVKRNFYQADFSFMSGIIPNASNNSIEGWESERLRIRIRGVPEKGEVNKNLITFLAKELGIAKSKIKILSGHTSRLKRIELEDVSSLEKLL
jgi:uncharacterized protein (TIGR00251 family)